MKLSRAHIKKFKEENVVCDCCKEVIDIYDMVNGFSGRGKDYCEECLVGDGVYSDVKDVKSCESCGDWTFIDQLTEGPDKGAYCKECLHNLFDETEIKSNLFKGLTVTREMSK